MEEKANLGFEKAACSRPVEMPQREREKKKKAQQKKKIACYQFNLSFHGSGPAEPRSGSS